MNWLAADPELAGLTALTLAGGVLLAVILYRGAP